MSVVAISFSVFILIFLGIGVYSATRKQDTDEDFLIASRSIGPWMMALSAVATNNSGFMFVGLIGSTYIEGVSGIVLIGGWVIGDYFAWLAGIPRALRKRSEEMGVVTIPSFLGWGMPGGRPTLSSDNASPGESMSTRMGPDKKLSTFKLSPRTCPGASVTAR